MFPTGDTSRVKLATELLLLGFLMDDWFDHHPPAEVSSVVSRLQSLLSSPSSFSPRTTIDRMHATLFARILADPSPFSSSDSSSSSSSSSSRKVLEAYMAMLACHCWPSRSSSSSSSNDSGSDHVSAGPTSTLGRYLSFREVDVGMPICAELLYWTEPDLLDSDDSNNDEADKWRAALRPLEKVAHYHVSILNDVFSFEREWKAAAQAPLLARDGGGGAAAVPLVNGVAVLAREANVSMESARRLCIALVRAWEVEFLSMAEELLLLFRRSRAEAGQTDEGEAGRRLVRVLKGIERRMTGAEAFSWRTSRYL
ncbi:terpenoid synthase [Parathielavia appendiculata]|uniref:Terpenoid synthase n=1 Tax=Parathielavia appendiculata TaxID=2587402 RepID=A0AAN6Z0K1_9PEZI|nr:terpenoid synthase [Parathielavia appendiculata]